MPYRSSRTLDPSTFEVTNKTPLDSVRSARMSDCPVNYRALRLNVRHIEETAGRKLL